MKKLLFALLTLLFVVTGLLAENVMLPADAESVVTALESSPRHGEWVKYETSSGDTIEAWAVYPERSDAAPVVVVVHEIFGLNDWARGVADQLAAEGFIAIAPDFLSGKGPNGGGSSTIDGSEVRRLIRDLTSDEIRTRIDGAVAYGTALPAATNRYGIVGFCWGGGISFSYATQAPGLGAAVAYYGTSPATETLKMIKAPVLGLYGGSDNRVNATIPEAEAEMKRLGKTYEKGIYDGAGHGFLRQLDGQNGANMKAAEQAWPRTMQFFRTHLEGKSMSESWGAPMLASYGHDMDEGAICEMEMDDEVAETDMMSHMTMK